MAKTRHAVRAAMTRGKHTLRLNEPTAKTMNDVIRGVTTMREGK
jgi:superfamily I DNA and RNA helicase